MEGPGNGAPSAKHIDSTIRGLVVKSDKLKTLRSLAIAMGIVLLGGGMTACSDDPEGSDPFNNETSPCSDVECPDGESCVVDGGEGVCEPDANNQQDACDGVICDEG